MDPGSEVQHQNNSINNRKMDHSYSPKKTTDHHQVNTATITMCSQQHNNNGVTNADNINGTSITWATSPGTRKRNADTLRGIAYFLRVNISVDYKKMMRKKYFKKK